MPILTDLVYLTDAASAAMSASVPDSVAAGGSAAMNQASDNYRGVSRSNRYTG